MNKNILILISTALGLLSCKENSKSTSNENEEIQITDDKNIYSKYKYTDFDGGSVMIHNSLPKGGMKYTDVNGQVYNYAVFWTRIINETDNALELNINIPLNSYEVPLLPGKYYQVLIPSETITIQKEPLFLYGLNNLKSFVDKNIFKQSSFKRTIKAGESNGFYVVILCLSEGAKGVLRSELNIYDSYEQACRNSRNNHEKYIYTFLNFNHNDNFCAKENRI
ncbi:hypothetical protein [Flavobacterium sp. PL002]|uniref:hypothetical protein n=1 Tax=Flavobacterium sp. PL002 TaxID=1897058 RepID=UPI0017878CD1|nr:hypothetical protein [Flavobacterium sp. PL002]MBE0390874.1 hypothetical protein [Flavobacterium sp. PL002]